MIRDITFWVFWPLVLIAGAFVIGAFALSDFATVLLGVLWGNITVLLAGIFYEPWTGRYY